MKPVSYQSMPPSVNGGHPSLAIDRVLTSAKVMYCEKCGFATTDLAVFKKHRIQHMEMKFFCFYCNNVSFSEAELNIHLKQHTSKQSTKYPFACPHCGQGYMRKLCLVKHIERLHSKSISQTASKPGTTKIPHVSVSRSLQSVPTADSASLPPVVRVTVPKPSAPAVRLGIDEQRGKTLDNNTLHATNGKTELLPPFNGLIQQSRALTVSLPEEVNIPAGCLVELVEVRTVNGTKELKLRLVSQQESESVIKDTRTVISENTPLGRPLPSTFSHPNTANSVSLGMCTVNRKPYEVKNVELPSVAPANINKNLPCQVSKEKIGLKRPSEEIIDLERNSVIPNKVPNSIFNSAREGSNGIKFIQREPVSQNAAGLTVTTARPPNRMPINLHPENRGVCVSQRAADQRNNLMPLQNRNPLPQKTVELKSVPREALMAAKLEPRVRPNHNHNTTSNMKKEAVVLSQQSSKSVSPSLSVSSSSAGQLTPALNLVCKEKFAGLPLASPRTKNEPPLMKTPAPSNGTYLKVPARTQDVRPKAKDKEPETFPVISSVFSLSQQPENVQGSIQPLMAALRGIAMNKSSGSTPQDHNKTTNIPAPVRELQTLKGSNAPVSTKNGFVTHNPSLTPKTCEPIKEEEPDKGIQPLPVLNHVQIKEENKSTVPTEDKKVQIPDLKPLKDEKCVSKTAEPEHAPAESVQQMQKSEHNISSRFLTVSLKRVQVGVWKKNKKGLKLRISKCKTQGPIGTLSDCAVLHLMPLKKDQLVKQPRPNQPVVVLNHPRPRASVRTAKVNTLSDRGAPKCQILKMRLSKVMGQKYEVMGCTVGVFS